MAIETLAQPYAWDGGAWKRGDGANKGCWVWDGSWKQVLELYVREGGQWKYVIPVNVGSCIISAQSDGTCGTTDASYRITSTWLGPLPQKTAGTGDRFQIKSYSRISSISAQDLLGKAWTLRSTLDLISASIQSGSITYGLVISAGTADRWHQVQARLVHSDFGEVPVASGGIKSSAIRPFHVDPCDG